MNLIFLLSIAVSGAAEFPPAPRDNGDAESSLVRPLENDGVGGRSIDGGFPFGDARVARVTTLANEGPGSLRAALRSPGPRIVVFEVGGVIDLGGKSLEITDGPVFVAGETAPAPGITLIRGSLIVEASHVVVRHLSVRPGDKGPMGAVWQPDGITIDRSHAPVFDVLIQNCSATWAVDENASVSGPADVRPDAGPEATAHDITFRDNLFAEALFKSTHPKGPHSMGLLVHDGIRRVRIEGNLFASNNERNPRLKGGVRAAVVGNVLYNWGNAAVGVGRRGNRELLDGVEAIVANNVAIAGPDTASPKSRVLVRAVDPGAAVRAVSNLVVGASGETLPELDRDVSRLDKAPTELGDVPVSQSPEATLKAVLSRSGARPAERDAVDRRIVDSIVNGSGRLIDSQEAVGGYPVRPATARPLTIPDGGDARRAFLDDLAHKLGEDDHLDVTPLLKRLRLRNQENLPARKPE